MNSEITAGVPKKNRPLYIPDFTATNILDVDFQALQKIGVKHVLVDLDLTLRKKMSMRLEPQVNEYLIKSIKEFGFESINIASNNMLGLKRYGIPISARIFQPYWKGIRLIRKPNTLFYQRILVNIGAKPSQCVMIGDKLRADVYGGNKAGLFTVWVQPKGSDYWYDRILFTRLRERRSMSGFHPIKKMKATIKDKEK